MMKKHTRIVLQEQLDSRVDELAEYPNLITEDRDRTDISLLVSILTLHQLERIASHLEDGQIAIFDVSAV